MISKQTSMAARAPMLRRSICSSCMSSQLAPEKPVVQAHLYRSFVSRLTQVPPLRQGLSRHSLRSSHPFPSGVTRWPRGHLNPTKPGQQANTGQRITSQSCKNVITVFPRSVDPFYIVSNFIKWDKSAWAYSIYIILLYIICFTFVKHHM